jgi:hypothetical protein
MIVFLLSETPSKNSRHVSAFIPGPKRKGLNEATAASVAENMPFRPCHHLSRLFVESLYIVCGGVLLPHLHYMLDSLPRRFRWKWTWVKDRAQWVVFVSKRLDLASSLNVGVGNFLQDDCHVDFIGK